MAWTYSGDPSTSEADAIRFEVGDTDSGDPLIQDEEIAYALQQDDSVFAAAARICRALAAKFARQVDKADGDVRLSLSQRAKAYLKLAEDLQLRADDGAVPMPFAGGISHADWQARQRDLDRVGTAIRLGMHDTV